jgi:hypothetical protein
MQGRLFVGLTRIICTIAIWDGGREDAATYAFGRLGLPTCSTSAVAVCMCCTAQDAVWAAFRLASDAHPSQFVG